MPLNTAPAEVKAEIPEVAQPVIDVVAEQVQKEHVSDDVQVAAVKKGVGEELPVLPVPGGQHPGIGPIMDGHGQASPPTQVRMRLTSGRTPRR